MKSTLQCRPIGHQYKHSPREQLTPILPLVYYRYPSSWDSSVRLAKLTFLIDMGCPINGELTLDIVAMPALCSLEGTVTVPHHVVSATCVWSTWQLCALLVQYGVMLTMSIHTSPLCHLDAIPTSQNVSCANLTAHSSIVLLVWNHLNDQRIEYQITFAFAAELPQIILELVGDRPGLQWLQERLRDEDYYNSNSLRKIHSRYLYLMTSVTLIHQSEL